MGDLLWMVQWAGFHLGYAARWTLILAMRERPLDPVADDRVGRLLTRATSNGWISELESTGPDDPGYVLTRKGERALAQYERRRAARGIDRTRGESI
jgi:hypothetical protein